MARWHSLLAVAVVGLIFLLTGPAVAQQAILVQAPAGDRVALASRTAIEVRDAKTKQLVWQAKLADIKTAAYVEDSSGRRHPRGEFVPAPALSSDLRALGYAPDGKRLALADKAGVVMFDADTGNLLWLAKTLPGVNGLGFSSDGKTLTIQAPDGHQTFDVATGKRLE